MVQDALPDVLDTLWTRGSPAKSSPRKQSQVKSRQSKEPPHPVQGSASPSKAPQACTARITVNAISGPFSKDVLLPSESSQSLSRGAPLEHLSILLAATGTGLEIDSLPFRFSRILWRPRFVLCGGGGMCSYGQAGRLYLSAAQVGLLTKTLASSSGRRSSMTSRWLFGLPCKPQTVTIFSSCSLYVPHARIADAGKSSFSFNHQGTSDSSSTPCSLYQCLSSGRDHGQISLAAVPSRK